MKKSVLTASLFSLFISFLCYAAVKNYDGEGEVLSVDPALRRVTLKHGVIQGYSGEGETEFTANDDKMLQGVSKRDFVHFTLRDENGNLELDQIVTLGEVEPESSGIQVGRAVRDVVTATGEAAKFVTSPIEPVHGAVESAMGATQEVTAATIDDATLPDTTRKF